MTWTYSQRTGDLVRDGIFLCRGYAGHGEGKNNPGMESVPNTGPIPCGEWTMTGIGDHQSCGPRVIYLKPEPTTVTYGRSGFLIHGDSIKEPGTASHGCIIIDRRHREMVWGTQDRTLEVTP